MSTEEETTLTVAAQMLADPDTTHDATIGAGRPGLHLELVDLAATPVADDDEWDLDPTADLGLKVMIGGVDPEVAAQLLRIAADFLDEATIEDDDEE